MVRIVSSRRNLVLAGIVAAVAVAGVAAWRAFRVPELLRIGTGYAAQQTCACLFVARRSLPSCRTDLDPLARRITWLRVGKDQVTASAFGIERATARYESGFGCSLRE